MKRIFFLTALFENKYGTAKKYYKESGWHWMLNFDRPKAFATREEAEKEAFKLEQQDVGEIEIQEAIVYRSLWEHKIKWEDISQYVNGFGEPQEVIKGMEYKSYYLFVSRNKQMETAQLLKGLYCLDRKKGEWIYCE